MCPVCGGVRDMMMSRTTFYFRKAVRRTGYDNNTVKYTIDEEKGEQYVFEKDP